MKTKILIIVFSAVSMMTQAQLTIGYLPKATSAVSITGLGNSAIIQSGTSIGIGITAPSSTLQVKTNTAVTNSVAEFTNDYFGVPLLSNTTPYTLLVDRYITKPSGPGYNVFKDLTVNSSGLVGAGVANAAAHLDVSDQNNDALTLLNVTPYGGSSALLVSNTGNVGIGNASPTTKLDVVGNIRINNNDIYLRSGTDVNHGIGFYDNVGQARVFAATSINGPVVYGYGGGALGTTAGAQKVVLKWNSAGQVVIGGLAPVTASFTPYSLAVNGTIVSKKVVVETSDWADKVFDKSYKLTPLAEVENYVATHKHLPEIPSECEVLEKGIDVSEMNKLLLQKVEELTLYTISLQKQVNELKK